MSRNSPLLLIGEVIVDFTMPKPNLPCKLRMGGIVHAARGMWSIGAPFAVAAACPGYLVSQVRRYLSELGCSEFIWIADVSGAPNVIVIGDQTEVSDQGYEDLLRGERQVEFRDDLYKLESYNRWLIFPGKFDIRKVAENLASQTRVCIDFAYDIDDYQLLRPFGGHLDALITSTSSELFLLDGAKSLDGFLRPLREFSADKILLKENRGGSRAFDEATREVYEIPALLGETVNSVGVGDVYSAVFVERLSDGLETAARLGARAATCYAQTTYPEDLKRDVRRSIALSVEQMRNLGGTVLPWHERQEYQIYFAAPDFSYFDRQHIEKALAALNYHNFRVRRPVAENGELSIPSAEHELMATYLADYALLLECDLVFALPQERDPGTLVEIGMALAMRKPVVTFDPLCENANTMVIAGSAVYSEDLDSCLNAVFEEMSKLRALQR